jgi:hypothetical protein
MLYRVMELFRGGFLFTILGQPPYIGSAVIVMIDLAPYCTPFNVFLANSIREFAAERPDVEVSCVLFYGCPQIWEGVLSRNDSA